MSLSKSSKSKLDTCHPDIQKIILAISEENSIIVIEGTRTPERQKELLAQKKTKTLNSKHLKYPSDAIDIAPLIDGKLDWDNQKAFIYLAQKVLAKAKELGIKIRWGGDWDRDGDWKDERFLDLVHFERD